MKITLEQRECVGYHACDDCYFSSDEHGCERPSAIEACSVMGVQKNWQIALKAGYSQGSCGSSAAILKKGVPMSIEEILSELRGK